MLKKRYFSKLFLTLLFLTSTKANSISVSLINIKDCIEYCLIKNKINLESEDEFLLWEKIVNFSSTLKHKKKKYTSECFANQKNIDSKKAINFIVTILEEKLEKELSTEDFKLIEIYICEQDYTDIGECSNIEDSLIEKYDEHKEPFSPKTKRLTRGEYKDYPGTPRARRKDKSYDYERRCKTSMRNF